MKFKLQNYPVMTNEQVLSLSYEILNKDLHISQSFDELIEYRELCLGIIDRLRNEHARFKNKYCRDSNKNGVVNPLYLDHYAKIMYYISRQLHLNGASKLLLDQIFLSIKSRCSIDLYYEIDIPEYFYPIHSISTVMGRANYNKYFCIRQNCTVGNNHRQYPTFGEGIIMRANSMVLGNCKIGNNVHIGAGTLIIDTDIPDNSVVFGRMPDLIIKENQINNTEIYFDV